MIQRLRHHLTRSSALAALLISVGLILGACSAPAPKRDQGQGLPQQDFAGDRDVAEDGAERSGIVPPKPGPEAEPQPPADSEQGRKVIVRGKLSLETADVQAALEQLREAATALGGYVQSESLTESKGAWYAELTLRVEAGREAELRSAAEAAGTIRSESSAAEDISASYYDTEARLRNARTQEARLLEMYKAAESVEDMVYIGNQLDSIQERIEQFQGQIRLWDQLVGLSTIEVRIYSESAVIPSESDVPRFVDGNDLLARLRLGLQRTFVGFVNGAAFALIWITEHLLQLLLLLLILFIVWRVARRPSRRRPRGPQPPRRRQSQPPHEGLSAFPGQQPADHDVPPESGFTGSGRVVPLSEAAPAPEAAKPVEPAEPVTPVEPVEPDTATDTPVEDEPPKD